MKEERQERSAFRPASHKKKEKALLHLGTRPEKGKRLRRGKEKERDREWSQKKDILKREGTERTETILGTSGGARTQGKVDPRKEQVLILRRDPQPREMRTNERPHRRKKKKKKLLSEERVH